MDQLSQLIARFTVKAGVFYTGELCGLSAFEDEQSLQGHIHILTQGKLTIIRPGSKDICLDEPGIVFFPRPKAHRISARESDNAKVVCATVEYGTGATNPISQALPDVLVLPFSKVEQLEHNLSWLIAESVCDDYGKHAIMDRLMEVLIISLLRHLVQENQLSTGLLAGLAHPQLAKVLQAIHQSPEQAWSVEELADVALMSRSKFSPLFKQVLGQTPLDYLTAWRVNIAQSLLLQGKPVSVVANEVGYDSSSTLSRAFNKTCHMSPKAWLQEAANK